MTKKSSEKQIVKKGSLAMRVLTTLALGFSLSMTLGMQSAWAAGAEIQIANGTVSPNTWSGDSKHGIDGKGGTKLTIDENEVYSIKTLDGVTGPVIGIYYDGASTLSIGSLAGGITLNTSNTAYGISAPITRSGTTKVSGLGKIKVSGNFAYGINNPGGNTEVTFSGSDGYIEAIGSGSSASGITTLLNGSTTVTNLCGIMASDSTHAYGIYSTGLTNTVSFVAGSTITATSIGGDAYGIRMSGSGTTTVTGLGGITVNGGTAAYGIYMKNTNAAPESESAGANFSISFVGGSISAYSATGTNYGIMFASGSTGKSEVKNVKSITAGENSGTLTTGTAYGIYAGAGVNSVAFTGSGSYINATSTDEGASGVYVTGEGTTTVSNLGSITATAGKSAMGIYSYGYKANPKNTVSFVTTGGTITATSTGNNTYGIRTEGTGTTSVENLAVITVEGQGNKAVYGIYSNGSDANFSNTVSFLSGGTITATSSDHNAYGIYVTGKGTTTIDGSGAITISATSGEGKTAYGICVGSSSTLNIGTEGGATQPSVTLASGTTSVFRGTTKLFGKLTVEGATMNFADGSMLAIDASNSLSKAVINGIDKASQLNITDGASLSVTNADIWQYYSVVSGDAVTDGTLTAENLWKSVTATDANGNKLCGDYEVKDGKVTVEFRNIPLAVEGNTSALAGVQQGAITMVNQIADAVGDNVGLLARPSLADAVYEKTIWANYINSKETVDGMAMWRGSGDNTAKYHGVTVGADFYTSKKSIAGVALTYVTGDVNNYVSNTVTNNKTKYYGISLYDRVTNGKSAWTYDLGYSQGKNEITQNSYQTITADAKTNAYTIGAKYEYAYDFKHSSLVPFASLRYLRLNSNDYSNSNGHNMSINSQNLIIPKLGLAWTGDFSMPKSDWNFKPLVEVGYIWNLKGREADGTFTSRNRAYDIAYDTVDKSSYYTKLGLNFNRKNFDVGVSYNYSKGDSVRNNKWNVNVSWAF